VAKWSQAIRKLRVEAAASQFGRRLRRQLVAAKERAAITVVLVDDC